MDDQTVGTGVWVVYDREDNGPYAISFHPYVMGAVTALASYGYGKIAWVRYGVDFTEGIKQWEAEHSA